MPSQTLTLTLNGSAKKVVDYGGSVVGLPDAIEALESAVDTTADTARWVTGTPETLPALKAEHYNFASPAADNIFFFNTALTSGNPDLIAAFVAAKAPITTPDPKLLSPICAATSTGNRDLVDRLLATRPQLKLSQPTLDDCLSLSAQTGKLPVVQLWLSREARVNFPIPEDEDYDSSRPLITTPLLAAVRSGSQEVVDLLLHHHAKIASKANQGRSLLSFALNYTDRNDPQAMKHLLTLLLQAGADPNEETDHDRPALYQVDQHPEAVPLLVQAGAKINQPDKEGKTALMWAYSPEAVKALLAAGADPTPTAPDGTTALKHAQSDNCKECATLIEAAIRARRPTNP
jgi:ankyrin repeat protein